MNAHRQNRSGSYLCGNGATLKSAAMSFDVGSRTEDGGVSGAAPRATNCAGTRLLCACAARGRSVKSRCRRGGTHQRREVFKVPRCSHCLRSQSPPRNLLWHRTTPPTRVAAPPIVALQEEIRTQLGNPRRAAVERAFERRKPPLNVSRPLRIWSIGYCRVRTYRQSSAADDAQDHPVSLVNSPKMRLAIARTK